MKPTRAFRSRFRSRTRLAEIACLDPYAYGMASLTSATSIPRSAEDAFRDLEARIVDGDLSPGARLPSERMLVEEYGVSRPAIREALRRLEERGLIVVQPGRGSFVQEIFPTRGSASIEQLVRRGDVTASDVVVARRMLECEAAALAAENRSNEDLERMATILVAFDSSTDLAVAAELDVAFHEAIAVASGNPVLQIMFGSIRSLTHGMVLRSLNDRRVQRVGSPIHHDILRAIERQNPRAARSAMARHVELARDHYGDDINEPLIDVLRARAEHQPEVAEILRRASRSLA